MSSNWAERAVITRVVCALAILMLGFAGNALAIPNLEPYGAEYRLPDGNYASLCNPGEESGTPKSDHRHCDMCVMAAGLSFAIPQSTFVHVPALQPDAATGIVEFANLKPILSHHGFSRGPPLSA